MTLAAVSPPQTLDEVPHLPQMPSNVISLWHLTPFQPCSVFFWSRRWEAPDPLLCVVVVPSWTHNPSPPNSISSLAALPGGRRHVEIWKVLNNLLAEGSAQRKEERWVGASKKRGDGGEKNQNTNRLRPFARTLTPPSPVPPSRSRLCTLVCVCSL